MIVLDASALVELLLGTARGRSVARHIADPALALHVPHLADVEIAQALRRYVRDGQIDAVTAEAALSDLQALDLVRHEHDTLVWRMWALRANLTAYDAVYVALAEALGVALLTCDAKLGRAPGVKCKVAPVV
jgi:predicted nucleic acid-binding protein